MGAYAAAKHGVIGATKSAALDYAAKGIASMRGSGPILNMHRLASTERREPIVRAVPLATSGRRRTWPRRWCGSPRTRRHS